MPSPSWLRVCPHRTLFPSPHSSQQLCPHRTVFPPVKTPAWTTQSPGRTIILKILFQILPYHFSGPQFPHLLDVSPSGWGWVSSQLAQYSRIRPPAPLLSSWGRASSQLVLHLRIQCPRLLPGKTFILIICFNSNLIIFVGMHVSLHLW